MATLVPRHDMICTACPPHAPAMLVGPHLRGTDCPRGQADVSRSSYHPPPFQSRQWDSGAVVSWLFINSRAPFTEGHRAGPCSFVGALPNTAALLWTVWCQPPYPVTAVRPAAPPHSPVPPSPLSRLHRVLNQHHLPVFLVRQQMVKVKAHELRTKSKPDLEKQLGELKNEVTRPALRCFSDVCRWFPQRPTHGRTHALARHGAERRAWYVPDEQARMTRMGPRAAQRTPAVWSNVARCRIWKTGCLHAFSVRPFVLLRYGRAPRQAQVPRPR